MPLAVLPGANQPEIEGRSAIYFLVEEPSPVAILQVATRHVVERSCSRHSL
jgi:hypothetical protein